MQYRKMGKLDDMASTFGLGCMRLPLNEEGKIDRPHATSMIRHAIDQGCNYVDTAYGYHYGESDLVVGEALKDGYREKVMLATKLPPWHVETAADFDRLLNEQLGKLQTEYVDFYLIHAVNSDSWKKLRDLGVLKFMDQAKADGRIRHAAFSFHDDYDIFVEIIDSYDWDMVQIQFNLLDEDEQAGIKGLQYAGSKGIPVVIMEPLKGGRLVNNIPGAVQKVWDSAPVKRTALDWSFRYLYDQPEVTVILNGCSSLDQVQSSIATLEQAKVHSVTDEERKILKQVQDTYKALIKVGCTGCEYCLPCPNNVSIPQLFSALNDVFLYDDLKGSKKRYQEMIQKNSDASQCIECGKCESLCPQAISIIEELKQVHAQLA